MKLEPVGRDEWIVTKSPRLGVMPPAPARNGDDDDRLKALQNTLALIQQAYLGTKERAVIVLEGWDTAGKGGLVRRLGWALDPRSFRVHPIGAPTQEELRQHYLQRFWRRMPAHGQIVVFDRSWYGRVLVERVEGLIEQPVWERAYDEINDFEAMLIDDGVRIVKIFLDITEDEQLRRFKERLTNPLKQWKLTFEDFRNRGRWKDYEVAIIDMMEKTSEAKAPWHLVPANNKPYGRASAFHILVDILGKDVSLEPRPLDPKLLAAAKGIL